MMGIFDKFKESAEVGKNAKWRIGAAPTVVILNDDYMNLKMGGKEIRIFYKDIQQIEQALYNIEIKTITNKYTLTPMRIKGGVDLADELHSQILEKIHEQKVQQSDAQVTPNNDENTASFCGNCGQKLEPNENFCPKCGTKNRKI